MTHLTHRMYGNPHAEPAEPRTVRRRNDRDREQWIANDEGLYQWCRRWRIANTGGISGFIRANRAEIDRAIDGALDQKPRSGP